MNIRGEAKNTVMSKKGKYDVSSLPGTTTTTSKGKQTVPSTTDTDRTEKSTQVSSPHGPKDDNSSDESVHFKRELGLWEAIALIMGIIIGSGIFVSPKGVIQYAGSVGMSLGVWTACGLMSTLGALCFTELGK